VLLLAPAPAFALTGGGVLGGAEDPPPQEADMSAIAPAPKTTLRIARTSSTAAPAPRPRQ